MLAPFFKADRVPLDPSGRSEVVRDPRLLPPRCHMPGDALSSLAPRDDLRITCPARPARRVSVLRWLGRLRPLWARSLAVTGPGRLPVGGRAPLLRRIMDNQGERPPECRTRDVQFHWNVGSHNHGSSGPTSDRARWSLQALFSREHVPAFRAWVGMHSRLIARPHDGIRENGTVGLCCGKLQRSDDGDDLTSPRSRVAGSDLGEPHSPVFLHHNAGRAPGRLRRLPGWKRAQVPVDGCLTEMQPRYGADVEAAELRSLLPRRHVHAGHFRQVLMSSRGGPLGTQVADWHNWKGDEG